MLKNISWSQYLYAALVIVFFYYLIVLIVYFRKDFLKNRAERRIHSEENADDEKKAEASNMLEATENLKTLLGDQLRAVGNNKDATILVIKGLFKRYAYLKGTPYAIAIHHFLVRETNQTVSLKDEEIRALWE